MPNFFYTLALGDFLKEIDRANHREEGTFTKIKYFEEIFELPIVEDGDVIPSVSSVITMYFEDLCTKAIFDGEGKLSNGDTIESFKATYLTLDKALEILEIPRNNVVLTVKAE